MGKRPPTHQQLQQRTLVAQTAARLIAEGGPCDFATAKRKAAEQLGVLHSRNLPDNEEIELALRDYQRLFQYDRQHQELEQLRQTALHAMKLLAPFSPRLIGSVLSGSADRYSPIQLHLFANTSEEVGIFMMEHHIPAELDEIRVRYNGGKEETRPVYRFMAGESALELIIFPPNGIRHAPLSPIDGRTMQRANLSHLQQLLRNDVVSR